MNVRMMSLPQLTGTRRILMYHSRHSCPERGAGKEVLAASLFLYFSSFPPLLMIINSVFLGVVGGGGRGGWLGGGGKSRRLGRII